MDTHTCLLFEQVLSADESQRYQLGHVPPRQHQVLTTGQLWLVTGGDVGKPVVRNYFDNHFGELTWPN